MHLFAGIGGGLLGDLILGHDPIIAVEWDKYACQVLRERAADGWFPGLQVWEGDVRLFDPSEYTGRVDCIHAGFPCQDISNAGKQAGVEEGTRSGLYREVLRIAGVVRPKHIFLENVSAILSVGLGTVLGDLASRGYDARWLCIKASDVGANHRRDRWFLLGYSKYDGQPAEQKLRSYETASNGRRKKESNEAEQLERANRSTDVPSIRGCSNGSEHAENMAFTELLRHIHGEPKEQPAEVRLNALGNTSADCEDVADTNGAQQQGAKQPIGSIEENADIGKFSWWSSEPNVGRVAARDSTTVYRLKGLGNMQVPLQAAVAFSLLYEGLK
jgi:DNA (cytosine-5)-methyltransferase 1